MREAIRFYCGIGERVWNRHPTAPGPYACIAPVYGSTEASQRENLVRIPANTVVIQDSGAFSDGPSLRLDFSAAIERQLRHSDKHGYTDQITHRASYDLLIDERWENGKRFKERWSVADAEDAVALTIKAAEFMAKNYGAPRVLSAQGVDAQQYLDCAERVVAFMQAGDIFGLGGWCITGKMPARMMPVFLRAVWVVLPRIAALGVRRVHIWGVNYAPALGSLLWVADQFGIAVSTDSVGPSVRPARGRWGYAEWVDRSYRGAPSDVLGLHRAKHVQETREWLSGFRSTRWYREPYNPMLQPRLF